MTRDRDFLRRSTAFLAAGLLAGCASASPGTDANESRAIPPEATARNSACAGDCSLRVENRLDVDVEVGRERQPALPDLGIVRANRNETFDLPDFSGHQMEVWIRDEDTQEILHVTCVRQFPRGTGRLILGSEISGGFGC